MRVAFLDCFSGISGDMTLAALIDAGASLSQVQTGIASLALNLRLTVTPTKRHGFRGLKLEIEHEPEHVHRNLRDIHLLIRQARIAPRAKDIATRIFERLARAEAKVHGTSIDRVHFHEVGAIDSIVDIVGTAIAWDHLQIDRAFASPIPTGTGQIRIAHGTVSVPAPATAEILNEVPIAPCSLPFEMTTPTGAAIVRELVEQFGPMPPMQVGRIGYGAGTRDLEDRPNLLRILVGESVQASMPDEDHSVVVIETNLDDVTGEQIGFAIERLWQSGALDVFTTPIFMKKGRPGTLLTVIAKPEDRKGMESILFAQVGTLGLRYRKQSRSVLPRAQVDVNTPWGVVRGKVSKLPSGEVDFSPEFDDCREIALQDQLRLVDVISEVRECYYANEALRETQAIHESDEPAVHPIGKQVEPHGPAELADLIEANLALQETAEDDSDWDQDTSLVRDVKESEDEFDLTAENPSPRQDPCDDEYLFRWDSAPW